MKRVWWLLLTLSLGLNGGLLYVTLAQRAEVPEPTGRPPRPPKEAPDRPGPGGGSAARPEERPASGLDSESVIRSHLERMTRDLHLDEAQRRAIAGVHETLLPQILDVTREMKELRRAVSAQYGEAALDEAAFHRLVIRLSRDQARLDSLTTEAILGEARVLQPEQRRQYLRIAPWGHPFAPREETGNPPPPKEGGRPPGPPAGAPKGD